MKKGHSGPLGEGYRGQAERKRLHAEPDGQRHLAATQAEGR